MTPSKTKVKDIDFITVEPTELEFSDSPGFTSLPLDANTQIRGLVSGALQSKIGSFTRAGASPGAVAITGVGFQPTTVIVFGKKDSDTIWSQGFGNATAQMSMYRVNPSGIVGISLTQLGTLDDGSFNVNLSLTSFDADGFTITYAMTTGFATTWTYLALA